MHIFIFRGAAWLLLIAVTVFTLLPIQFRPITGVPADIERFVAFALIGAMFCLGYPKRRLLVILLVVGLAGALEVSQYLVPGRHGHVHDVVVKVLGAIAGAFGAAFIGRLAQRIHVP